MSDDTRAVAEKPAMRAVRAKSRIGSQGHDQRKGSAYALWARYGLPAALAALIVLFSILTPTFLTYDNLTSVMQQRAVIGIAAIGTTMVIIGGGIDITMGAVIGLTTVVTMLAVVWLGVPMPLAALLGLVAAAAVGLSNGYLITRWRIPALIATLGMLSIARGFAAIVSNNESIAPDTLDPWFAFLGRGFVGPVPASVVAVVVAYFVAHWIMLHTRFGTHTFAIGSSETSARLAGIRVDRHRLVLYVLGSTLSGFAGLLLAARLGSGWAVHGTGWEFEIIAAVLLGGTSIFGGRGSVMRTLLGVTLIGVLGNGMNLLNINSFYQTVATGVALIFAVGLEELGNRSRDINSRQ